LFWFLNINRR